MPLDKIEIPVRNKQELSDAQSDQVDVMHNAAYRAMCDILGYEPEWSMEWIGKICDTLSDVAQNFFHKTEMEIYPYISDEEEFGHTENNLTSGSPLDLDD